MPEPQPDEEAPAADASDLDGSKPRTPRWRRAWRRLLAGLLGSVLAVLLLEAVLRVAGYSPAHVNPLKAFHVADPLLGFRGRPDLIGRFTRPQFDVLVEHDAGGFRKHVHAPPDRPRRRLWVLGDSFTWGWGVDQGEVFTDKLAALLPDTAVVNRGVNAANTAMELALLEREVLPLLRTGDEVLVVFFENDFFENVHPQRLHGTVSNGAVVTLPPTRQYGTPLSTFLKRHSYAINFVAFHWDTLKLARERSHAVWGAEHLVSPAGELSVEARVTRHYLGRLRDRCAAAGAAFAVAWVASERQMDAPGRREPFHGAFLAVARSLELRVIDPTEAFLERHRQGARLFLPGDDAHWTRDGHELMAHELAEALGP